MLKTPTRNSHTKKIPLSRQAPLHKKKPSVSPLHSLMRKFRIIPILLVSISCVLCVRVGVFVSSLIEFSTAHAQATTPPAPGTQTTAPVPAATPAPAAATSTPPTQATTTPAAPTASTSEATDSKKVDPNAADSKTATQGKSLLESLPFTPDGVIDILKLTKRDVDVLQSLSKRAKELREREKRVIEEEKSLELSSKKVKTEIESWKKIHGGVQNLVDGMKEETTEEQQRLAKVYTNMKPKDAAPIISSLPTEDAIAIFSFMKEKSVGAILALMNPEQANEISAAIATKKIDAQDIPSDTSGKGIANPL